MSKFRLNCRPLEDTACRIHARHPAQLDARFDNAVGVGHHRHSDSPLRPRPNSVILSSVLAALLYAASSEDHRQAAIVKRTGTLLLALFLGVFLAWYCEASVYVSDGSAQNVQYVHDNLAVDGDTITLPVGTFSWTSSVTITKTITLQGAGTFVTGGGDQSVIIDNYAANQPLIRFTLGRITGLTVQSGTGSLKDGGTINVSGAPGNVRIDHCHLLATTNANYKMIAFWGGIRGVLDHCILDFTGLNALYFYNGRKGAGDIAGNLEWSLPTAFGSSDYFFIEDNIINGTATGGTYNTRIFDGFTAAKVVARFNTLSQSCIGETHATGHSPDDRGLRSQEIYGNTVTSSLQHDPNFTALDIGNGTTLVWGNSWNNVYKSIYHLQCYSEK